MRGVAVRYGVMERNVQECGSGREHFLCAVAAGMERSVGPTGPNPPRR